MQTIDLSQKAGAYLNTLCLEITTRRVGSEGNRAATHLFAKTVSSFGFHVELQEFDCIDWGQDGAELSIHGRKFPVFASPYSLGCRVEAPLKVVASINELEAVSAEGAVLLLRGELTKEQIMPKNFPFFNPEEHQKIIGLLEEKRPQAVIAATGRNPELAGGAYPFPLFEDGDFGIPSVYMTDVDGLQLAELAGESACLESRARRIPARAINVVASKGGRDGRRIAFTAHIDAKLGTPGALDNAAGVTTLLLLAELLKDYDLPHGVEITPFNGEDYYSAGGEVAYLQANQGKLERILLNVNLDGLGHCEGDTAYSLYQCPDELAGAIRAAFSNRPGLSEGDLWYQGDHMVFVQNGVPAVAITSHVLTDLMREITHTEKDVPGLVDPEKLASAALALRELTYRLGDYLANE
jgi:aminopeptidase YwaD